MKRTRKQPPKAKAWSGVALPCPLVPLKVFAAWAMGDWEILNLPNVYASVGEDGRQIVLNSGSHNRHDVYTDGYLSGYVPEGLEVVLIYHKQSEAHGHFIGSSETVKRARELMQQVDAANDELGKMLTEDGC